MLLPKAKCDKCSRGTEGMRLVRQMTEKLKKGKDIEGNLNQKEYNDENGKSH